MAIFFVSAEEFDLLQKKAFIRDEEDIKHITKVLRMKNEDEIEICNGLGVVFLGKIEEINKGEVRVELVKELDKSSESPVEIHLLQGIPKGEKMEFIVQKCTELGVNHFIPVEMHRSVVVLKDKKSRDSKVERWQKVAREAAKQSGRTIVPKVGGPIKIKDVVEQIKDYDAFFVPYEKEEGFGIGSFALSLSQKGKERLKIGILIGPEGGFEDSEIELLKANHAHTITLGNRILRTETAGLSIVSIVQFLFGDMG